MAIGWFICPMVRGPSRHGIPTRKCAMDENTAAIFGEGGAWDGIEVLGNVALCKVRASAETLTEIAGATGFVRILAKSALSDSLADLTTAQRTAILNKLQDMGYTADELVAAMGGTLAAWRTKTLGDLLRFAAKHKRKPRYNAQTDTITADGDVVACPPIADLDARI